MKSLKDLAILYHKIIEAEYEKSVDASTGLIKNPDYFLVHEDLERIARASQYNQELISELIKRGYVIEIKSGHFRTLHMDIAVRCSDLRVQYCGTRYVASTRLFLYKVPFMDSEEDRIYIPHITGNSLERGLYLAINELLEKKIADLYISALRKYIKHVSKGCSKGLDAYQIYAVLNILRNLHSNKKVFILSAPTGSGKTEIFLIVATLLALKDKLEDKVSSIRVTIIYPRKDLESDQASRFILFLYILNKELTEGLGKSLKLTIGIDDGMTKHLSRILEEKSVVPFRGVSCPNCGFDLNVNKAFNVFCSNCKLQLDFIRPTHSHMRGNPPDIYITNPWTLEYRLCESPANKSDRIYVHQLRNVKMIILDEAHEYKALQGGALRYVIRTLDFIAQKQAKIVLSSATIPHPKEFAIKLTGFNAKQLEILDYSDVVKELTRQELKVLSGERISLIEITSINPHVSWATYVCQLAILLSTIYLIRRIAKKELGRDVYIPQGIIFVDNIHEIRRIRRQFSESIYLGDPRDHLRPDIDPLERYSYLPYVQLDDVKIEYLDDKFRISTPKGVKDIEKLEQLLEFIAECHSEVPTEERTRLRAKLINSEIAIILSTSTLELGVDYKDVGFIVNVGFPNPLGLIQRIGRGGRSINTLFTVLGAIVVRNIPTEMYWIYKPNLRDLLDPEHAVKRAEPLNIAYKNPAVMKRAILHAALTTLALENEQTFTSGVLIKNFNIREERNGLNKAKELYSKLYETLTKSSLFNSLVKYIFTVPDKEGREYG